MIKIITGIPGAGKTLWAVTQLKKIVDENNKLPENQRRKIYSDITGLELEGVIKETPLDWRETDSNSLIVYDEAQFNVPFQASAKSLSEYDYIRDLTIHRKTGHELWYITQDPKRLHTNILEMAESHFHLDRPFGAKYANVYQFRGVERSPKSTSAMARAEVVTKFIYSKKIYQYYESSQVKDGIKLRIPKKMIIAVAIPLIMGVIAYMLFTSDDTQKVFKGVDPSSIVDAADGDAAADGNNGNNSPLSPSSGYQAPVAPVGPVEHISFYPENVIYQKIANIVSNDTKCMAMDINGALLDIPVDICFKFIDNPYSASFIPMDVLQAVNVENPIAVDGESDGSL